MDRNNDKDHTSHKEEPKYLSLLNDDKLDSLYLDIYRLIVVDKKYLLPDYSAKQLSIDLNVLPRYISATFRLRFQKNFTSLVNEHRVKEACKQLSNPMLSILTIEEVALRVGYVNRQSFYSAFCSIMGQTPKEYKDTALGKTEKK